MKYEVTPKTRENMQGLVGSFGGHKVESRQHSGHGKAIAIGTALTFGGLLLWLILRKKTPAEAEPGVLTEVNAIDITSDLSLNDGRITSTFPVGTLFTIKLYDKLENGTLASGDWARAYDPAYLTLRSETVEEKANGEREWRYDFSADVAGDTTIRIEHFSTEIGFDKYLVFNLRIT